MKLVTSDQGSNFTHMIRNLGVTHAGHDYYMYDSPDFAEKCVQ